MESAPRTSLWSRVYLYGALISIALVLAAILLRPYLPDPRVVKIDADAAHGMLEENPDQTIILDVREKSSGGKAPRIPGALRIPLRELEDSLDRLHSHKEKTILCIGQNGLESHRASRLLAGREYPHVYRVRGGMDEWIRMGLPTVEGASEP